jgi:hypothetical protein
MYRFEGQAQPRTPAEDERELELGQLNAHEMTLKAYSPAALTLVMALQQMPQLSGKEFEDEIAQYNAECEKKGFAPTEGKSEDFTVPISPTRSIFVRMFENGRVELIGREGSLH